MLKFCFTILVCLSLLGACNTTAKQKIERTINNVSERSSQLNTKLMPIDIVNDIKKIETNVYSFVGIQDWYDDDTVFYLRDENGYSYLYTFNFLTGEEQLFFEMDEPIISIEANPLNTRFAIRVARLNGSSDLYFVNKKGEEEMLIEDIGEAFQLHWNDYLPDELVIIALQHDYTFQISYLDLFEKNMKEFPVNQFYIQWLGEKQFAFLDWEMFEPSYFAPLYLFDLEESEKQLLQNEIISFFSFYQYFFTISVNSSSATESNYRFYDSMTRSNISKLQVPILNTYSEQWWIPNHTFDYQTTTFYYMKPDNSGDLYHYNDGYSLMAFDLLTETERKILNFDQDLPLRLSPNGRWLLVGYQLEKVIDLESHDIHSLLHW